MELIYIDSDDDARQTDMRAANGSDAETWATFRSYRRYAVDIKTALFLLDYHKANNDLADTIPIDATGFKIITGQEPKSDAEYRKIDSDFWDAVRKDRKAA